jgi:hypothetical protein
MKLSEIKEIKKTVDDWREAVENILDGEVDFELNDYRFIHDDNIDEIMVDELESDEYILGCFNSWFLADVTGIDCDVIDAMQKADAYEAVGKLIISLGKIEELQQEYVSADGYGHHFNHWDGGEIELNFSGRGLYHVFRIN